MNLATGLKEARLNVPEPKGGSHADLVIIENPPQPPIVDEVEVAILQDQSSPDARHLYAPPRPVPFDTVDDESDLYNSARDALLGASDLSTYDFSTLQDLAHSIHWGYVLASDVIISHYLLNIFSNRSSVVVPANVRAAAALLLGTAMHNHLDALEVFLKNSLDEFPTALTLATLKEPEQDGELLEMRTVFLLSQLCQDDLQLKHFLDAQGLDTLLSLFNRPVVTVGAEHDKLQIKIANFIHDRILSRLVSEQNIIGQAMSHSSKTRSEEQVVREEILEPWCSAFTKGLESHQSLAGTRDGEPRFAGTQYAGVFEAHQALNGLLRANSKDRGCLYDMDLLYNEDLTNL